MSQDPLIGKTLANFRIDRVLGRGGMAVVYLGTDIQLDRPVAIKLINAQFQGQPEYASRFVSEAKLVARWRHENIISVYYAGEEDDLYYFVMEFIDGASLSDLLVRYLKDGELMPQDDVLRIARAVAGGLDYAHQQQVVHRDVKPANIMISRNDRVVITDFGLALDMNMGSMGQIFGTPHYVAPEQVRRSSDASPQSDIYSFGIVLYEMLTGALPFDDPSATALAMQHLSEPPPKPRFLNPELPQATEDVLMKALAKEPSERYETAMEMVEALEKSLNERSEEKQTSPAIMPPAAISQQETNQPRISRISITDMLELELKDQDVTSIPKATKIQDKTAKAPQPVAPPEKSSNNMLYMGIGAVVIIVILAGIGFFLFGNNGGNGDESSAVDLAATSAAVAQVETEESDPLEVVTATTGDNPSPEPATAVPTATIAPTEISITLVPTDDVAATDAFATSIQVTNAGIEATNNAVLAITVAAGETLIAQTQQAASTQQAIATQQAAQPTEAFPNGRLLDLTYNSAGFYVRNSSSSRVRDSRLAFVAINDSGSLVSPTFSGGDWAQFYSFIDTNRCVAIELLDQSSWTRPTNCQSGAGGQFNSLQTWPEDDSRIFWTGANGATQFVVFWDDVPVATCDIADGFCQVRVGS